MPQHTSLPMACGIHLFRSASRMSDACASAAMSRSPRGRRAMAAPDAAEESLPPAVAAVTAPSPASSSAPHDKRLLVSFDALGVLSNRYGLILETLLSQHDAVTAFPW